MSLDPVNKRPNPFRKRKGHWTTIRRFATKRFVVKLQWEPEQFADLSWMDAADHRKIESGHSQADQTLGQASSARLHRIVFHESHP